jgi:hypothetical protein
MTILFISKLQRKPRSTSSSVAEVNYYRNDKLSIVPHFDHSRAFPSEQIKQFRQFIIRFVIIDSIETRSASLHLRAESNRSRETWRQARDARQHPQ